MYLLYTFSCHRERLLVSFEWSYVFHGGLRWEFIKENKKVRKQEQELDQESDQEKKKTRKRLRK